MFFVPEEINDEILSLSKIMKAESISFVNIRPFDWCLPNNCHLNCSLSEYETIEGYYVCFNSSINCYEIFAHSVVKIMDELVDITPSGKSKILFLKCDIKEERYSYLNGNIYINKHNNILEKSEMYYVYALIDPRNMKPFYVGKGKNDRWKYHIQEAKNYPNLNNQKLSKIRKILNEGFEIGIEFLAIDILDEDLAYHIESEYIKQYGRIVDGGILTNVCIDNRPPSHKGKSYLEIYGDNANFQRKKRHEAQLSVGGYFKGGVHDIKTREKMSNVGKKNREEQRKKLGIDEIGIKNLCQEFFEYFDNKYSKKRWIYFIRKIKKMSKHIISPMNPRGINNKFILDFMKENFVFEEKYESSLWFHNPNTKKQFRISDWMLEKNIIDIPDGFITGRLQFNKKSI